MDHLPHPTNAIFPPVVVPYYDQYEFDGGTFSGYPTRCGFDKTNFIWGDFSSVPLGDHSSFFQAWFYFGILHDFFGASKEDFVDRHTTAITTAKLPDWARRWQRSLPIFSRVKRLAEYERTQQNLREACDALIFLDSAKRRRNGQSNLSEEVAFSISVLGVTIEEIKGYHDGWTLNGGMTPEQHLQTNVGSWPTTELASKRLEAAGWCRSEVNRLETYMMVTGIFYCGSMQNAGRRANHSECTDERCGAEDVDEGTYVTMHEESCLCYGHGQQCGHTNHCRHSGPMLDEVAAILEAGNYPVLALSQGATSSDIQIKAVPYRKSMAYTAISHVWADGLGNAHANSLPQCQIERLYELLRSLRASMQQESALRRLVGRFSQTTNTFYVWIDTLCIPHEQKLRKTAIALMYEVYKKAVSVLVLDKSMMSISVDRPLEELCFRISAAPWMRRAWTLQEGALARSLRVQLQDGVASPRKMQETLTLRIMDREPHNVLFEESCSVIRYLQHAGAEGEELQLSTVLRGLSSRSTSHIEDKEICFAVTLGLQMGPIMEAKDEVRTMRILQQLPYIPQGLFWHVMPSLDLPGFRWAPKDIFSGGGGVRELGLQLTDDGLLLAGAGMIVRGRTRYIHKWGPHIRDFVTGQWYNLRWLEGESFTGETLKSNRQWTALAVIKRPKTMLNPIVETAVLRLAWDLSFADPQQLLEHFPTSGPVAGEFVGRARFEELDPAVTERLKGKIRGAADALADLRTALERGEQNIDDVDEELRRKMEEEEEGDQSWVVFDGMFCDSKQQWCVT